MFLLHLKSQLLDWVSLAKSKKTGNQMCNGITLHMKAEL